jgi:hypothetical protein
MANDALADRLNRIIPKLEDPAFLANEGIGNEIGFYIFDYPPDQELAVRDAVAMIEKHFAKSGTARIATVNLFDVMLDVLKGRKVLDAVLKSETTWGPKGTKSKVDPVIKKNVVAEEVLRRAGEGFDVLLLTGVGSAYPLIRTHEVLNNLHDKLDRKPLVVFFPGEYTMQELRLFGLLDANYYRAFRLVS